MKFKIGGFTVVQSPFSREVNPSPKSLLKDGVVATDRVGGIHIYFDGKLFYLRDGLNLFGTYDNVNLETLKNKEGFYHYDIMKLEFDGKVLWEREEKPFYKVSISGSNVDFTGYTLKELLDYVEVKLEVDKNARTIVIERFGE